MLDDDVKKYIDNSVLCWLATCSKDAMPNVSPKEMFTYENDDTLLIAHIASPNTVSNIRENPNVCVSFVDVFVQKGYKLRGTAKMIYKNDDAFHIKVKSLTKLFSDKFPVKAIIEIKVTEVSRIIAPSYSLFPAVTTEESQIKSALLTYRVAALQKMIDIAR